MRPHTSTHNLSSLPSVAAIVAIIQQGKDWFLANGFTRGAYDFALPFGSYNNMVLEALKECGVQTDRTVMLRITSYTLRIISFKLSSKDPNGEGYPDGPNYTTMAQAEKFVNHTIQNKSSPLLYAHQIDD